jgi:hypothetical protein
MLHDMLSLRLVFDLLGGTGAARNAGVVLDAHRTALAEVDSVVARLQRQVAAHQPAA